MERVPGRWRKLLAWTAIGGMTALLSLYACICIYSAHVLTSPSLRSSRVDPKTLEDASAWSTRTDDGLTLRGWYCPTADHRDLIVCVHGMWDNWGIIAPVARDLHRLGHDVLLFDLRGHGSSDPARLTMGRAERADLRAALAWARQQGFTPDRIGWLGQSMGAATILYEGLENPDIRAAVFDSPYGDLPSLLDDQLTRHSGLPSAFNPGILLAAEQVYGVRTSDLVPLEMAVGWGKRPLLVLHGEVDTIVPVSQARELAKAAGSSATFESWPGSQHIQLHRDDAGRYVGLVDRFFRETLSPLAASGAEAPPAR